MEIEENRIEYGVDIDSTPHLLSSKGFRCESVGKGEQVNIGQESKFTHRTKAQVNIGQREQVRPLFSGFVVSVSLFSVCVMFSVQTHTHRHTYI